MFPYADGTKGGQRPETIEFLKLYRTETEETATRVGFFLIGRISS